MVTSFFIFSRLAFHAEVSFFYFFLVPFLIPKATKIPPAMAKNTPLNKLSKNDMVVSIHSLYATEKSMSTMPDKNNIIPAMLLIRPNFFIRK